MVSLVCLLRLLLLRLGRFGCRCDQTGLLLVQAGVQQDQVVISSLPLLLRLETARATSCVKSEIHLALRLRATVLLLLLRGSFHKAEHGVVTGEGPSEATPGGRRGLEVVPTPLGGRDSRM